MKIKYIIMQDAYGQFMKMIFNLTEEEKTLSFDEWLTEFNSLRTWRMAFKIEELEEAWSNGKGPQEMANLNDKKVLETPSPWKKPREEILASLPIYSQLKESILISEERYPNEEKEILKKYKDRKYSSRVIIDYANNVIGDRWPEAEEKILKFGSGYDLCTYAIEVIKDRWPEAENRIIIDSCGNWYALNIIKNRWPELEQYILKKIDRESSFYMYGEATDYIIRILGNKELKIQDRSWPELEALIIKKLKKQKKEEKSIIGVAFKYMLMTDRKVPEIESFASKISKLNYVEHFEDAMVDALKYSIKNNTRLSKLEPLILNYYKKNNLNIWGPWASKSKAGRPHVTEALFNLIVRYSKKFIGRWKDLENEISKNAGALVEYSRIMRDRFPEIEQIIIKHPSAAYEYARDIMKSRWREAEPKIFSASIIKKEYEELFCKDCEAEGRKEISGGEKIECHKCFGSGFDPEKLKEWESRQEGRVERMRI